MASLLSTAQPNDCEDEIQRRAIEFNRSIKKTLDEFAELCDSLHTALGRDAVARFCRFLDPPTVQYLSALVLDRVQEKDRSRLRWFESLECSWRQTLPTLYSYFGEDLTKKNFIDSLKKLAKCERRWKKTIALLSDALVVTNSANGGRPGSRKDGRFHTQHVKMAIAACDKSRQTAMAHDTSTESRPATVTEGTDMLGPRGVRTVETDGEEKDYEPRACTAEATSVGTEEGQSEETEQKQSDEMKEKSQSEEAKEKQREQTEEEQNEETKEVMHVPSAEQVDHEGEGVEHLCSRNDFGAFQGAGNNDIDHDSDAGPFGTDDYGNASDDEESVEYGRAASVNDASPLSILHSDIHEHVMRSSPSSKAASPPANIKRKRLSYLGVARSPSKSPRLDLEQTNRRRDAVRWQPGTSASVLIPPTPSSFSGTCEETPKLTVGSTTLEGASATPNDCLTIPTKAASGSTQPDRTETTSDEHDLQTPTLNEDAVEITSFSTSGRHVRYSEQVKSGMVTETLKSLELGAWLSNLAIDTVLSVLVADPYKWQLAGSHLISAEKLGPPFTTSSSIEGLIAGRNLIIPVHLDFHWILAVVNMSQFTIEIYDSFGKLGISDKVGNMVCTAMTHLTRKEAYPWRVDIQTQAPQQPNGYDCGVYIVVFALYRMHEMSLPATIDGDTWRRFFHHLVATERGSPLGLSPVCGTPDDDIANLEPDKPSLTVHEAHVSVEVADQRRKCLRRLAEDLQVMQTFIDKAQSSQGRLNSRRETTETQILHLEGYKAVLDANPAGAASTDAFAASVAPQISRLQRLLSHLPAPKTPREVTALQSIYKAIEKDLTGLAVRQQALEQQLQSRIEIFDRACEDFKRRMK